MHPSRVLFASIVLAAPAFGQEEPAVPAPSAPQSEAPDLPAWSFEASVYTYFVPHDREYVSTIIAADRSWQHFELRYNYEDLDTVSAWLGGNLSAGEEELTLEITPMIGVVFGNTNGIAPGYKGTLGWRQFEFYSEGEYVIDADDHSFNFFYSWSELTFAPVETFRFGLVTQRTRLYDEEGLTSHGLLAGIAGETWSVTGYLFDPDDDDPTFVLSVGASF
jgi:hypothetical protein